MSNMIKAIVYILVLAILVVLSFRDIKKRKIDIRVLFVSAPLFMFLLIGEAGSGYFELLRLIDIVIGLVSLIISHYSKEAIGKGDAYLLIWCALVMDFDVYITSLAISMLLSFLIACFCILKGKKKPIPFVPLLTLGFLFTLF